MDLSSMLEREDFFPLFFDTIQRYYNEVYDTDVKIDFAHSHDCNLVIKPFLSAATSPQLSVSARQFFYSEWNVRSSLAKHLAAKMGVAVLTHSGKLFAKYKFCLTPQNIVTKDLVIAPNNRSIRFFDYGANTVGCIVKSGFTDKFFRNQLNFRQSHNYPFMLPMLKWGTDWFVEPILKGHPLARVTNESFYRKGFNDALAGIHTLAEDTRLQVSAGAYVAEMLGKIETLLSFAEQQKKIQTSKTTKSMAQKAAQIATGTFQTITLCDSHGDFQGGNIWVDENSKTWIYDWETVGRRSIWYDSAVLCYALRKHEGWNNLSANRTPDRLLNCDTRKQYCANEYAAIKAVVLLEDMLFYLEDMMELPQDWGRGIYDSFIHRIEKLNFLTAGGM